MTGWMTVIQHQQHHRLHKQMEKRYWPKPKKSLEETVTLWNQIVRIWTRKWGTTMISWKSSLKVSIQSLESVSLEDHVLVKLQPYQHSQLSWDNLGSEFFWCQKQPHC